MTTESPATDSAIQAPFVSPEVANGAASTRTEAQAREQRIGEAGQRAFFETAATAQLLFLARSEAQALNQRDYISRAEFDERLVAECRRLVGGDELKARLLASAAIWGG